jgi:hypothetical protein
VRPEDDDLRERFAALREQDEREGPGFAQLRARALARRRVGARRWALAAATTATLALFALIVGREPQPRPSMPSLAEWRAPTDFLLKTPGREVLTLGPSLDRGSSTALLPAPSRSPIERRRRS